MGDHRFHLQPVEQFDAGDGNAALDCVDHRHAGRFHARERTDPAADRLRDALQLERQLGDDAERPLRADEQAGEIVARGALARPPPRRDQPSVGGNRLQCQHIVLHRPVAHRIGARRARRGHAAEAGIGAGIDREEQAGVAQVGVQVLARHARLDAAVEVAGIHLEDAVHAHQVDGDAARRRVDLALQRGSRAEGDHRHMVLGADAHHLLHVVGGAGKDHRVRRLVRNIGRGVGVLLAHRRCRRKTLAETLLEDADRRRDSGLVAFAVFQVLQRHSASPGDRSGTIELVDSRSP